MTQVWPWPSRSLLIGVELARELRRNGMEEEGLRLELTSHWIPFWKPRS